MRTANPQVIGQTRALSHLRDTALPTDGMSENGEQRAGRCLSSLA
jgi:hypothetical protein